VDDAVLDVDVGVFDLAGSEENVISAVATSIAQHSK
jgi:hypothetical protein